MWRSGRAAASSVVGSTGLWGARTPGKKGTRRSQLGHRLSKRKAPQAFQEEKHSGRCESVCGSRGQGGKLRLLTGVTSVKASGQPFGVREHTAFVSGVAQGFLVCGTQSQTGWPGVALKKPG